MKPNNRDRILAGVIAIIEKEGLTAVTFDAVAAETGITRGGLIYHFRSREDLIRATHEFLAGKWRADIDARMKQAGGDRRLAYILAGGAEASRAEMLLMLDSVQDPEFVEIWSSVRESSAPPVPAKGDAAAMARFIAGLASDGLWMRQALERDRLPDEAKARVLDALLELAGGVHAMGQQ